MNIKQKLFKNKGNISIVLILIGIQVGIIAVITNSYTMTILSILTYTSGFMIYPLLTFFDNSQKLDGYDY